MESVGCLSSRVSIHRRGVTLASPQEPINYSNNPWKEEGDLSTWNLGAALRTLSFNLLDRLSPGGVGLDKSYLSVFLEWGLIKSGGRGRRERERNKANHIG